MIIIANNVVVLLRFITRILTRTAERRTSTLSLPPLPLIPSPIPRIAFTLSMEAMREPVMWVFAERSHQFEYYVVRLKPNCHHCFNRQSDVLQCIDMLVSCLWLALGRVHKYNNNEFRTVLDASCRNISPCQKLKPFPFQQYFSDCSRCRNVHNRHRWGKCEEPRTTVVHGVLYQSKFSSLLNNNKSNKTKTKTENSGRLRHAWPLARIMVCTNRQIGCGRRSVQEIPSVRDYYLFRIENEYCSDIIGIQKISELHISLRSIWSTSLFLCLTGVYT